MDRCIRGRQCGQKYFWRGNDYLAHTLGINGSSFSQRPQIGPRYHRRIQDSLGEGVFPHWDKSIRNRETDSGPYLVPLRAVRVRLRTWDLHAALGSGVAPACCLQLSQAFLSFYAPNFSHRKETEASQDRHYQHLGEGGIQPTPWLLTDSTVTSDF